MGSGVAGYGGSLSFQANPLPRDPMTAPTTTSRGRLRFEGATRTPSQDGHETIHVHLEWSDEQYVGEARGVQTR